MNVNKVTLLGYLAQDVRSSKPKDTEVSTFPVATNYNKTTEYHSCIAWGKLAGIASKFLHKGDRVYVEGRLQTRNWIDKEKKKHSRTEIVLNHLIMLGRGNGAARTTRDEMDEEDQEGDA